MTKKEKEVRDKIEEERTKRVSMLESTMKQFSTNENYTKKPTELFGDYTTILN